jgi:hypothetical protein
LGETRIDEGAVTEKKMQLEQLYLLRRASIDSLAREIDPEAFADDATHYLPSGPKRHAQEAAIDAAVQIVDSEWLCHHERQTSAQTIGVLIAACKAFQNDPNYKRETFDISAVLDWLKEAEGKFLDGTFTP